MSSNSGTTSGTTSGGSQATTTAPTAIPTNTAGLDEAFLKSTSDYVPVPENGDSVQPRERGDFELEPVEDDGSIQSIASNGIYTNPVGDGDGEQSGMLRDVLNLRPDSVKSTNEGSSHSSHSSENEFADWTSSEVLAEAARLEKESDRSVLIKTEEDSDNWDSQGAYWDSQGANSMSDYSTNDSSYEETDAESLEQSNTLALAEKSGAEQWNTMGMTAMPGAKMDEDPDSQNPAKRRKLSSASTSISPSCSLK
ncbi:hypothetical protein THAOC_15868 [Thalassiosira oceanica]|uniref:Uncharacterized protein n=1 Tax=Thalassiosira oceanica TaxID=159749 RepID=K0SDJ8_THAOC|nr:hypothetical protein THAOC_15868 [Thalassiosira oceanica]|eukprot:EJK63470.1 hypothetical protein THAOC_15868 [Thalassiosira oceanica]